MAACLMLLQKKIRQRQPVFLGEWLKNVVVKIDGD